ncbi:MAG: hypothetical protein BYD32DRAFT_456754 [Podila humilis]|nr:MAG: hypothetical protein BYD32DRAFT_456754 [Podila humilis]
MTLPGIWYSYTAQFILDIAKPTLAVVTCLASAAMAQAVNSIFCQARYITNVATCVIGVKECNAVERFSSCVCTYTQNKPQLRQCLIALIRDPDFVGTLCHRTSRLCSMTTSPL